MPDLLKFTKTTLTGGGATAVDGISATALVGNELCWATVSDIKYLYRLNPTSGAAPDGVNIIIPVVGTVGNKRWILQGDKVTTLNGLTLTAQTTGWTGTGGTTSKTLTVSSDADTKDIIKGDGTAGRVFRSVYFLITNGTNANTVKVQRINRWNGDAEAEQDNIAKNATTGNYSLDAGGTTLTWLNSGITGDAVAVFAGELYNCAVTVAHTANVDKDASGITIVFRTAAGGTVVDMTSIIDTGTGQLSLDIVYITSA